MSDSVLALVASQPGRSTRAIIDLDTIAGNIDAVIAHLTPDQHVIAVVKAAGYGHGAVMVARTALQAGANMLAVATVGEAAELRAHDIDVPILLLGPIDLSEVARALELNCEITLGSIELVEAISAISIDAPVHLKIDTGMHRYGCAPTDAVALAKAIETRGIVIRGICTHFSSADEPDLSVTTAQQDLFNDVVRSILPEIAQQPFIHVANSAGALRGVAGAFIRLGVAMYGLQPGSGAPLLPEMRPALSVISRLARVHVAHRGDGISYGRTYVEPGDERLGLVPIGYADGLHRLLSNRGWMAVDGTACAIRGRVCMDQTVIGGLPESAGFGSVVGVLGPIGGGPSLDQVAEAAETINYEVATAISARVSRFYVRDGKIVGSLIENVLLEA